MTRHAKRIVLMAQEDARTLTSALKRSAARKRRGYFRSNLALMRSAPDYDSGLRGRGVRAARAPRQGQGRQDSQSACGAENA